MHFASSHPLLTTLHFAIVILLVLHFTISYLPLTMLHFAVMILPLALHFAVGYPLPSTMLHFAAMIFPLNAELRHRLLCPTHKAVFRCHDSPSSTALHRWYSSPFPGSASHH